MLCYLHKIFITICVCLCLYVCIAVCVMELFNPTYLPFCRALIFIFIFISIFYLFYISIFACTSHSFFFIFIFIWLVFLLIYSQICSSHLTPFSNIRILHTHIITQTQHSLLHQIIFSPSLPDFLLISYLLFYCCIFTILGAPPVPINKCAKCDKTVYKAEEVSMCYVMLWDVMLFTCNLSFLPSSFISFLFSFLLLLSLRPPFLSPLPSLSLLHVFHSSSPLIFFLPLLPLYHHTPLTTPSLSRPSSPITHTHTQVFSSGGVWHKSCFTCGALCDVGCNRVLARDNFLQHCGVPFCKVSTQS